MPDKPSLKEFARAQYLYEISRRAELTSGISLPLGIISAILGALVIMAKDIHLPIGFGNGVQLALVALSATTCFVSGYFLVRSFYGFAYAYVVTPSQIADYKEQLITFYVQSGVPAAKAEELAEADALDHLDTLYTRCTERNTANNERKSYFLHMANGVMLAAILLAAVAGGFHVATGVTALPSPHKVEVINMKEMPLRSAAQPPDPPPPPPPPQPMRPVPPPERVIKEDRSPPRPPPAPPSPGGN